MEKVKNDAIEGRKKEEVEVSIKNLKDYHARICKGKISNKLVTQIKNRVEKTFSYIQVYKDIRDFIKLGKKAEEVEGIAVTIYGEPQYPEAKAFILNGNEIVELSLITTGPHVGYGKTNGGSEEHRLEMGVEVKESYLHWDGSIDTLVRLIEDYKKENTILLTTAPTHINIEIRKGATITHFLTAYDEYLRKVN